MSIEDDDRTRVQPPAGPADPDLVPTVAVGHPAPQTHGNGLPIGTRLGEFEVTRLLGEGGFGIVYLATDHSLQRSVALKEYMPSSLAMRMQSSQVQVRSERHRETFDAALKSFVNEARLLAQFDHPALVKVHRFWEGNGTAYMVMPFYEGVTLKDELKGMRARGNAGPDEAWLRELLAPLCEALQVIHAENCYHRDIAPDNVMLLGGSHRRPLLLDFGAARRVIGDMTQALTAILKPGYAPVEQYAEVPGMKQGPWTDVYALAAVIYAAITGRTPPPSVGRLLHDDYKPLTELAAGRYSEGFLAAVDRALVVRPEQRTPDIATLRRELGLGEVHIDIYSTNPLPPGAERQAMAATVRVPAPAAPGKAAAPAPAAPRAGTAEPAAARPSWLLPGAGAALLGVAAVGAYLWLSPAAPPPEAAAPVAAAPAAPQVAAPATPQAAAPAVTAAAPGSFDVDKAFADVVRAGTPGFEVDLKVAKSPLRIGRDLLEFSVAASREGYLYVLAHGSDGSLIQLYPNTVTGAVKLGAGERLSLPKPPVVFEISEPPGPGRLLVIVSPRQRDLGAMDPRTEGAYRLFPTGADAARIAAAYKGPEPVLAGRPVCPNSQACGDEYGAATAAVDTVR